MHLSRKLGPALTLVGSAIAYYILDKLFHIAENLLTGSIRLEIYPVTLLDISFIIIGLTGIGLLIYNLVVSRKKGKVETTIPVYRHLDLLPLETLFSGTKKEISLVGITLESLNHITPIISDTARRAKVRILVTAPSSDLMERIDELVHSTDTGKRIEAGLGMLKKMHGMGQVKQNLQIKAHDRIPANSMIIVDPDSKTKSGTMLFEPYTFETPQQQRRIYGISQKKQTELFEIYHNSYLALWAHKKNTIII